MTGAVEVAVSEIVRRIVGVPLRIVWGGIRRSPGVALGVVAGWILGIGGSYSANAVVDAVDASGHRPAACYARSTDGRLVPVTCSGAIVDLRSMKVVAAEQVDREVRPGTVPADRTPKSKASSATLAASLR